MTTLLSPNKGKNRGRQHSVGLTDSVAALPISLIVAIVNGLVFIFLLLMGLLARPFTNLYLGVLNRYVEPRMRWLRPWITRWKRMIKDY